MPTQESENKGFEKLKVWQKGQDLTVSIYRLTRLFPKDELFGLTNQLRRAIVSVPTNIAEAHGRFSYRDRVSFLINARGSLLESRSLVKTAVNLGYIKDQPDLENEMIGLTAGINSLIKSMRSK